MKELKRTRFIVSVLSVFILGGLAFYAIAMGNDVTPPLCVTGIGGIAGYYTYGKTQNNDTYMETTTESNSKVK